MTETKLNEGSAAHDASQIDKLTGTTADERADMIAKGKDSVTDALTSVVDKAKANPKTAAAIAAGAVAAVAGAAYGATKLAKGADDKPAARRTGTPRKTPANKTPAKK